MTVRGTVLVTGASGFVGSAVVRRAAADGWRVRAASRRVAPNAGPNVRMVVAGDLADDLDWSAALKGVDAVAHCAARVHLMSETAVDPIAAFRAINVAGTLRLAHQAAAAGVPRFVYLSTLHVNGNETFERPFSVDDEPAPRSPYALSKHEAELALAALARASALELVVIRPPLVVGPGVGGNFARMLAVLHRGVPLPFATVHNQRSLVGRDNLADLIVTSLAHPQAAGRAFLVSDDQDLSTPELLRRTATALGKRARLFPMPKAILRGLAHMLGRGALVQQLCGSLRVDSTATRECLGWAPTVPIDVEIQRAADHFLSHRRQTP